MNRQAKRKRTKKTYTDLLDKYGLTKEEMPDCINCEDNKYVVPIAPDSFGFEFRCTKCRVQWAQPI